MALLSLAVALIALTLVVLSLRRAHRDETRYEALLENLPQTSVSLFDRGLRLVLVRGETLREQGLAPEEIEGRTLADVLPPEQAELLMPHYVAALAGESRSVEYRSALDGRDYWLRVVPIGDPDRVRGGLAIAVDISERKQAERSRDLSEAGRRRLVDAMNEAYVAIESDGRISDWNDRATQTFGYTRAEAIGAQLPELIVPPEDREQFWWLLERFTTGERADKMLDLRVERSGLHRDGHTFPIELAATTIRHDEGVTLHTFMHDISERRRDRRDLEAHAADLEALAEASAELARSTTAAEARESICRAAGRISEAEVALLMEPTADGRGLHVTAAVGADGDELAAWVLPFSGDASGAVRSFISREPIFSPDMGGDSQVFQPLVERTNTRSGLWVPVELDGKAVGVIALAWREPMAELPERVRQAIQLTAAEAAVAIERSRLLGRLERMARTDDLTGLPNRRAWDTELAREMAQARRRENDLSVAMVDLDRFKDYNDSRGHQAGDRLLKEAAGAWRSALRESDLLTRYGGEEFAIALPDCDAREAHRLIERLRAVTPQGESCSAGIATWDHSESAAEIVGRADVALYEAKQLGRDRAISH